jgi:alpha-tubulin suppressor-like RCC1 family protein
MTRRWFATALSVLIIPATLVAGPVHPASATLAPVQVVTGGSHTCALAPSGQAYCWGLNTYGELGDNSTTDRSTPVAVQQGGVTFTSIAAGQYHTCALTGAGAAWCWGVNWYGGLGDNSTASRLTPVAVQQGGVTFTSITAGQYHTCGLTGAGAAYCWGYNGHGGLGDNSTTQRLTPVAVQQGGVTFTSITAGYLHTCGLTSAGAAYCWGLNTFGELGDNSTTQRLTPVAVQQGGVTFTSITAGRYHTCGLTGAGAAYCWGYNGHGGLGDNSTTQRLTPVAVQQGGVTFTSITAGYLHTCGLTSAGAAYCWGWNVYGQLGDNTTTDRHTPVAVGGGLSWSAVVSSEVASHTCAVKLSTQLVYCWGHRFNGPVGDNSGYALQQTKPVTVGGGLAFIHLATGLSHTCGLTGAGAAWCWGYNGYGQLGENTTTDRSTPVAVQQGGVTFTSITAGWYHTCGLTGAGAAYCWGWNVYGQLGDNTTTQRNAPVAVQQGGVTFTSITAGWYQTCGLTGAGAAYCWGLNTYGELGDNTTTQRNAPVAVQQGGVTFTSITAGYLHTCALTGAGAAWCWGVNWYGELGDNTTTQRNAPVAVQQGGVTFTSIAAGGLHTCALTGAGAAWCWGYNGYGELGDNTTTDRSTPVAVQQGGVTFASITAGYLHTCGLTSAGAAWCWGYNGYGELGDNSTTQRKTPVAVVGGMGWSAVVTSEASNHTCALAGTQAYCWGYDSYAQLGDWTGGDALLPVQTWYFVTSADGTVSATVDPALTFTVSTVAASAPCGDVTTTVASATNVVPLGHLAITAQQPIGGQSLNVATNAANGYTVWVSYSAAMSGVSFGHTFAAVGGTNASPAAWPGEGTEAFGYTTQSNSLSGTAGRFHSNKWATLTGTGAEIMRNATTPGAGGDTNCIAFRASKAINTPPDTYSTTVLYAAVPLF